VVMCNDGSRSKIFDREVISTMLLFTDICQLRLDFETFAILGPATTTEVTTQLPGGNCPDQMKITVSTTEFSKTMLDVRI